MSVNHQPAYFLKVLLVLRATFNLQSNLFSWFLWPIIPSRLVAFTHTSHTIAPTHASHHHPCPWFHQHPFFLLFIQLLKFPNKFHHWVKVKWQFLLAPVFVGTCCPRCFSLYCTTQLHGLQLRVSKQGTSKPSTRWKLITAESLWDHPSLNHCSM